VDGVYEERRTLVCNGLSSGVLQGAKALKAKTGSKISRLPSQPPKLAQRAIDWGEGNSKEWCDEFLYSVLGSDFLVAHCSRGTSANFHCSGEWLEFVGKQQHHQLERR
jgi:hypothetical protein